MAEDYRDYFNNKLSQELAATSQKFGRDTRFADLQAATNEKIAQLGILREEAIKQREIDNQSWVKKLDLDPNGLAADIANIGASVYQGISNNIVGPTVALPHTVGAILDQARLTSAEQEAYTRYKQNQATPEDIAMLNQRKGVYTPSAMELARNAEDNRKTATDIRDAFNRDEVIYSADRRKLSQDLGQDFQSAWDQTGLENLFTKGKEIGGAGDVVSGLAKLIYNAGKAAVNNPAASMQYMAENLPQMFVGGAGKAGSAALALTNAQYGADLYFKSVQKYQADNNGAMPPPELAQSLALQAAGAAALEHAGELGQLKAAGKIGNAATEATKAEATKGFKEAILNAAKPLVPGIKATAAGMADEAITEGVQTYLEGNLDFKPATAKDIYEGAAIGGISGGGLSGSHKVVQQLTGTTEEAIAKKKEDFIAAVGYAQNVKDNNADFYLTPENNDPVKAMKVLFDHAQSDAATPETKVQNYAKALEILDQMESEVAKKQSILDYAGETREELNRAIESATQQLQNLDLNQPDQAKKAEVFQNAIDERQAAIELQDGGTTAIQRQQAEVDASNKKIKTATNLQVQLANTTKVLASQEQVNTDISVANSPVNIADPASIDAATKSIERVIQVTYASPDKVSPQQALAIADNMDNGLTEPQRTYLREFSKARIEQNLLETTESVNSTILNGSKAHKGVLTYQAQIGDALLNNDFARATRLVGLLSNFANDHTQKAEVATKALEQAIATKRSVQVIKTAGSNGTWQINTGKPLGRDEMAAMGGVTAHPNSPKSRALIASIPLEAKILQSTHAAQVAAMNLRFAGSTASATPATQTTATPSSVAPVASAVPKTTVESPTPNSPINNQSENKSEDAARTDITSSTSAGTGSLREPLTDPVKDTANLAKHQPLVSDRKLEVLNDVQRAKLEDVLQKLAGYYGNQINSVTFYIQDKLDANGKPELAAAFIDDKVQAIGLHSSLFGTFNLTSVTDEAIFEFVVAHELGHVKDKETAYASENAEELSYGGIVYTEISKALKANQLSPLAQMAFGQIFKAGFKGNVPKEIFANLHAFASIQPDLLKKELPNGYQFIQGPDTATTGNQGTTETTQDSSVSSVSERPADTKSTESTDTGTESQTGKLDALVGDKSSKNSPFIERNLLVDHVTQQIGDETNLNYQRPLVAVKNFFSTAAGKFTDFLAKGSYTASEKQNAALGLFNSITPLWSKIINNDLVEEDKKFHYTTPFNWLIKKEGNKLQLEENVTTAMVYAALNALTELDSKGIYNTQETIASMVGLSSVAGITPQMTATLTDVGMRANVFRNAIGSSAMQALGFKVDKDAPKNLEARLEAGFAGRIEKLLIDRGLVEVRDIPAAEMQQIENSVALFEGRKARSFDAGTKFKFIRLKRQGDKLHPDVTNLLDSLKGSNGILDKLFGVQSNIKYPSLTPLNYVQTKTKGKQEVPSLLAEVNQQNQQTKNFVREDLWRVLSGLDSSVIEGLIGIVPEGADQPVANALSTKAKNDGLRREWAIATDFVNDILLKTAEGFNQPIYFSYDTWIQQRVGLDGSLNPQSSKIHRALMTKETWKTEIDPNNLGKVAFMKLFVAESFGVKIDRMDPANSLEKFSNKLADPVIAKAIDDIQANIYEGTSLDSESQDNLLKAVRKGGENLATMDAIVAMAHLQQAIATNKPVTVSLPASVDGVTNGPILGLILFSAGLDVKSLNYLAEKGGIYTDASNAEDFPEWKDNPANKDLYETVMDDVLKHVRKAIESGQVPVELAKAVSFFTGDLREKDKPTSISSAARKIIKPPVTESVFGAGVSTSIEHMALNFVDSVYAKLAEVNLMDEADKAEAVKHINYLLYTGGSKLRLNASQNLNDSFLQPEINAIKQAFGDLFGEAVTQTMETQFSAFKESTRTYNQLASTLNSIYENIYVVKRQEFIQELIAKEKAKPGTGMPYGLGKVDPNTGKPIKDKETPLRDLTTKEEEELAKRLAPVFPIVQTLLSRESNQPNAGLRIASITEDLKLNPLYRTATKFKNVITSSDSSLWGKHSLVTQSFTETFEDPGVAMLPLLIHSLDSYISHTTQKDMELLNVHDSVVGGLNTIAEASEKINKVTFNALLKFSPMGEMYHSLENMITGLSLLKDRNELTPEILSKLGKEGSFVKKLMNTHAAVREADTAKLNAMLKWVSVNQYALTGGAYTVTEEDTKAVEKALEATKEPINPLILQRARDLDKLFKAKDTQDNKPKADNAPILPPSNTYSTHDIFNAIDTNGVSPTFRDHLSKILTDIVERLHGSFGTLTEAMMKDTPLAPIDVFSTAMATGVAPFASELVASGFKFDNQSMFVAEQIEATVRSLISNGNQNNSVVYNELVRLEKETRQRLKVQDFHKGDWNTANQQEKDKAQALYDYLFNKVDTNYLARFAALGLAHEDFNKLLQVPTKLAPKIMEDKTIAGVLGRVFQKITQLINGKLTNTKPGQAADLKLNLLVRQLVEIENKRKVMLTMKDTSLVSFMDKTMRATRKGARTQFANVLNSSMFMHNKNAVISAGSRFANAIANNQLKYWFKGMQILRNRTIKDIQGTGASILGEMNGPAMSIATIFRLTKTLEKHRKDAITFTSKAVIESFVNKGKDLTTSAKASISNVLLRSGAYVLQSKYDMKQLETLLRDTTALNKEIQSHEDLLKQEAGTDYGYVQAQSAALGYFLVTGQSTIEYLLKNANNIAKLAGTKNYGKFSPAQEKKVTELVDVLTSLYALRYNTATARNEVADVLGKENARTDEDHGIRMVFAQHEQLELDAKERLFDGSEALMQKGYTPEIYNPHTDIQVVEAGMGKDLENLGYTKVSKLGLDPMDPATSSKEMYVLRDGGLLPWLSGIFSYTSMKAKGTQVHSGYNQQVHNQIMLDKQNAMAKYTGTFDPTKVTANYTVPLLNSNMYPVNFQYMMTSDTKDTLLERNNDMASILGTLAGNTYDKEASSVQNKKAVELFYKEFKANYTKHPDGFMAVSATSSIPELREIYSMLPKATKDHIREIWGKDEMLIDVANLDIAFGYRKKSLSTVFDKDEAERNSLEKLFHFVVTRMLYDYARVMKHMSVADAETFSKSAAVRVRRAENMWQALVHEVKDIYVVKNITTSLDNIKSNYIMLMLYGVPVMDIVKDTTVAWIEASKYRKTTEEVALLKAKLAKGYTQGSTKRIENEIARLESNLSNSPVHELMVAGMMPTIVEDVGAVDDPYSYKAGFIHKMEKFTNKINPHVKNVAKHVYMAHDTPQYKVLSQITQLSDFVGKYALYKHLTTRKHNPIAKDVAMQEVSDAFINYDIPMHRNLQYLDDMGFSMFNKYFLRIQRVIRGRFIHASGKMAGMMFFEKNVTNLPTILDSSVLLRFGNNPFSLGALNYPSALGELPALKMVSSIF